MENQNEAMKHIVTEQDLIDNPEMVEQGIKVGDEIEIQLYVLEETAEGEGESSDESSEGEGNNQDLEDTISTKSDEESDSENGANYSAAHN